VSSDWGAVSTVAFDGISSGGRSFTAGVWSSTVVVIVLVEEGVVVVVFGTCGGGCGVGV